MFFFFSFPDFASRLNELRKSKGLTLEQLGEDINATRASLSNLENEKRKPSLDMIIKLADYFNVSIDYLVGRTDNPTFYDSNKKDDN